MCYIKWNYCDLTDGFSRAHTVYILSLKQAPPGLRGFASDVTILFIATSVTQKHISEGQLKKKERASMLKRRQRINRCVPHAHAALIQKVLHLETFTLPALFFLF